MPAPSQCPHCGYDLAGLPATDAHSVTCPECGAQARPVGALTLLPPTPLAMLFAAMCAPLACLLAAGWAIAYFAIEAAMLLLFGLFYLPVLLALALALVLPPLLAERAVHSRSRRPRQWKELRGVLVASLLTNALLLIAVGWPLLWAVGEACASV